MKEKKPIDTDLALLRYELLEDLRADLYTAVRNCNQREVDRIKRAIEECEKVKI